MRPLLLCLGLTLLLGLAGPAAPVLADEASESDESLEKKVEELDQKVRILERENDIKDEAAEKAKATAPVVTAGKDGFSVKSADGAFALRIRGYVQADSRFFHRDTLKPQIDTFVLRRARPIFEGTVYKIFDFRLMPDFGLGTTVLQDAYLEARFSPLLKMRTGKFKSPFGLERLQSATDILFVERALPTNLVPNRDLGIQLGGDVLDGVFSYSAGVFNGVADGASADIDTNGSKEFEARVFAQPFMKTTIPRLKGFGIGVAGTSGVGHGTPAATGLAGYRSAAQVTFFNYHSDGKVTGTALTNGRRVRYSPQGYYYWGRFGAIAEYVRSKQRVQQDLDVMDLENDARQGSVSFLLTDDAASFKGVSPKKPFDPKAGGWGAFELTARYGRLRVDPNTFPLFADPTTQASRATEFACGLNWYLNRNVKWMFDYSRTRFKGGAAIGDRETERIVLNRFQISF